MFTYNTIEVENFKFNNHHKLGDTNNSINEQNNIPNYHNIQNNSNLRNNQNIKYHNSEISRRYQNIDSRPTYGAYIHNTLPRGPYLQYKFNDYKQIHNGCINKNDKLLSLSIPQLSSQSSSSTMTINDNNHSNNSDRYRINRNDLHNIDNLWNNKTPCIQQKQRQTQTLGRYKNNCFANGNDIFYNTSGPRNHNELNQTIGDGGGNLNMPRPSSSLMMLPNDLPNVTNMHARCISTSYADDLRKENGRRLKHLNEIGNRNGIVITESCYENELKLNMNKKTSTVISGKRITASDHIKSASNNGIYSYGSRHNVNKKTISNHKNYVTLHDVLNVKATGLNQIEGWALLCQSIQALQDLFLSDSHSFTRILPLINPSNLQITSRGRIALNLMSAENERHESNSVLQHINGSPFKDIMDYLSPEYIKNIDQSKIYSISDIEKMWIYSLGVTLRKTLINSSDKIVPSDSNTNRINANEMRHKSSLDFVISAMREQNIHQRASLMYLLDIISEYCKTNNQHKPFSHIIIELFNEAITKNEISTYPCPIDSSQHPQLHEQRIEVPRNMLQRNSDLKVVRINSNVNHPQHLYKSQPILVEQNITKPKSTPGQPIDTKLQVVRKRNDILRKRKDNRRNTIHGTNIDLQTANKIYNLENNLTNHKSNDVMNQIHSGNSFNCAPEQNFDNMKALTLPNLKIRRYNLIQNANKTTSPNHGPEFIMNSNLPVKVINLIDDKSLNRRLVNVILLNGQQLHIYCNGTNTTTYQLLETIIKLENIIDNFFLGLCTLIGGDFIFLPKELKINKIAPATWLQSPNKLNVNDTDLPLNLFLRIKFFLPKFRGSETLNSCNFLYFQLRKSVLERHILCTEDDLITLGGLALQAEVGDFEENMKYVEYFTITHYLPEEVYRKNKELARYIRNSHLCKKGLRPSEARDNFVRFVQELKEYGLHLYTAKWIKEKQSLDIYLAISLSGICIFERNSMALLIDPNTNSKTTYQRKIYETFDWMEIQNLNFSKHLLGINVRKNISGNRSTTIKYKFKMCDKKSYFAFTLASEHHKFCLKLRKSFHSLKPLADELNIPIRNNKNSPDESPCNKVKSISSLNKLNEKSKSEPSLSQAFEDIVKAKPNEKMNRFKNIKISMHNDNRLKKIKNKLLRRSNSVVGNADDKQTADQQQQQQQQQSTNNKNENKLISKEENQNRENECPRVTIVEQSKTLKSQCNTMNRNKVKMGTRVFSPHFLSKSVDNILNSTELKIFSNNTNSFKCNKMNDSLYDETCSLVNLNASNDRSNPLMQQNHHHPIVIHSSIPTIHSYYKDFDPSDGNRFRAKGNFTLENESISETLLEKFNNISCSKAGDRVIKTIFIKKDLITLPKARSTTILSKLTRYTPFKQTDNSENLDEMESKSDRYTLGISIIEGKDNNVYVKDLITNGPGERNGIKIGDQILAVNGISLFHIPYNESLKILQTTEIDVKLTVAQLIGYHVESIPNVSTENNMTITSQEQHTDLENFGRDSHRLQDSSMLNSPHNSSSNTLNDSNGVSKFTTINICQNIISKRMLNLPKGPAIYHEKINKQSRRFDGHTIYPVTPAKVQYI